MANLFSTRRWNPFGVGMRPVLVRALFLALTTVAVVAVAGCSAEPDPSDEVTPSVSRSAIPGSYRYLLESSCGERGLIGRYRVVVRDGVVTSVENLNDDYDYEPSLAEVPTLAGLADKAESAEPEAVVDLVLDGSGLPKSLSIDHLPESIDDEECYDVSELEVLD